LRLFLLRHAKSDWVNKGLDDFDRSLSPRGLKAAPRIGAYMRERNYVPNLVKCSSSKRTRETWDRMAHFFEPAPEFVYLRSLYLAQPKDILAEIRRTPNACSNLLLIGHNPGIGALALALAALPEDQDEKMRKERLAEKFPTACLAVFDFTTGDWRQVKPLSGRLTDYMQAKDLSPPHDIVEVPNA
jgi:phosphohistidine phosphatase